MLEAPSTSLNSESILEEGVHLEGEAPPFEETGDWVVFSPGGELSYCERLKLHFKLLFCRKSMGDDSPPFESEAGLTESSTLLAKVGASGAYAAREARNMGCCGRDSSLCRYPWMTFIYLAPLFCCCKHAQDVGKRHQQAIDDDLKMENKRKENEIEAQKNEKEIELEAKKIELEAKEIELEARRTENEIKMLERLGAMKKQGTISEEIYNKLVTKNLKS